MSARLLALVILVFGLAASGHSFAQESSGSSSSATQPEVKTRIIYKEKSYYDFEDTLIRGDRPFPDGSSVFRKDRVKFRSKLDLNRSFMPELKSSSTSVH